MAADTIMGVSVPFGTNNQKAGISGVRQPEYVPAQRRKHYSLIAMAGSILSKYDDLALRTRKT